MGVKKTQQNNIFAREGWATILFAILLCVVGWYWHIALGILSSLWLGFCLNFFRNPKRLAQALSKGILSPADGKIIVIAEAEEKEFLKQSRKKISIFMSPLDVHVNRAPVSGLVKNISCQSGKFLAAFDKNASDHNERFATHVVTEGGEDIVFVQIAGWLARRIINYLRPSDTTQQGKIFGLIKFGSRMDIYFPGDYNIKVSLGQKVKAGETWLAGKD